MMSIRDEQNELMLQGDFHRVKKRYDEALACYKQALEVLTNFYEQDEKNICDASVGEYCKYAIGYAHLADIHLEMGNPEAELNAILLCVQQLEKGVNLVDENDYMQTLLHSARSRLKYIRHEFPVPSQKPKEVDWVSIIALAREGDELLARGRVEYAWTRFKLSIEIMRQLTESIDETSMPESAQKAHSNLAKALRRASHCFLEKNDKATAMRLLAEARDQFVTAAGVTPAGSSNLREEAISVKRYMRMLDTNDAKTWSLDMLVDSWAPLTAQAARLLARRVMLTPEKQWQLPIVLHEGVLQACRDVYDHAVAIGMNPKNPTFETFLDQSLRAVVMIGPEIAQYYRFHAHLARPSDTLPEYQMV